MAEFASAAPPLGGETGWPAFVWLAGLLEGEGTFLKPAPSCPCSPIISCRMTDLDIVELVAAAFGTSVQACDKGPYRTEYAATIRGSRAVRLMRLLRPMMGVRRRAAIDRALANYSPPVRKLNFDDAESIRRRYEDGERIASIARSYQVAWHTIEAILDYRMYPIRERFLWRELSGVIRGATAAGTGLSWAELYWLAGWLEGEGSFGKPPPSSHRRPRISGSSCDKDVIDEVARLLRVKPGRKADRRKNWTPIWRVLLQGGRAITLMQAMAPVMGSRRRGQIERAVDAASKAGALLGWHENLPNRISSDDEVLGLACISWRRRDSNSGVRSRTIGFYRYSRRFDLAPRPPLPAGDAGEPSPFDFPRRSGRAAR